MLMKTVSAIKTKSPAARTNPHAITISQLRMPDTVTIRRPTSIAMKTASTTQTAMAFARQYELAGCTDETACNFNLAAEFENGSCIYFGCGNGCTDPLACNYDSFAAIDNGSCIYNDSDCAICMGMSTGSIPPIIQWEVVCISDADLDGICDCDEIPGCSDSAACNYASSATDDDGSCTYAEAGYDCDGNCLVDSDGDQICDQDEVTGCKTARRATTKLTATDAGYCVYADGGYDCDGNCVMTPTGRGL